MNRFALATTIAMCLATTPLYAQSPLFTVTVTSASVYQAPSAGSQVIGHSSRGTVLDVRNELTGWIEVAWPNVGKAYVSAEAGRIEKPATNRAASPAATLGRPMTIDEYVHGFAVDSAQASTAPQATASSSPVASEPPRSRPMTIDEFVRRTPPTQASRSNPASPNPAAYVKEAVDAVSAVSVGRANPPSTSVSYLVPKHHLGFGARIDDMNGLHPNLGVTGRVWSHRKIGVQFEMFRDRVTYAPNAEQATWLQFAPSVLYSLPSAVNDYLWLRPYLGAGATIYRSSFGSTDGSMTSSANNSFGTQFFGGAEMTFAGAPYFALSADAGYRKIPTGFAGLELSRLRFSVSGHWFVR